MTTLYLEPGHERGEALQARSVVIGALYSPDWITAATSVVGRRALRVASVSDVVESLDDEAARIVMLELGHPGFWDLCTRLSITGMSLPLILLLPRRTIPAEQMLWVSQLAEFAVAHSTAELPSVLRRTMMRGITTCDAHSIARSLTKSVRGEAANLGFGLYVAGSRNASVAEAEGRLGMSALRNRLRSFGMMRAATILGWAGAVSVVWRLEVERCSLSDAARAVGFETARQCSDRVVYHTGRTPTVLRDRFGFASLVDEFVSLLTGSSCRAH